MPVPRVSPNVYWSCRTGFYWPEAILGNFYLPVASGSLLVSSPAYLIVHAHVVCVCVSVPLRLRETRGQRKQRYWPRTRERRRQPNPVLQPPLVSALNSSNAKATFTQSTRTQTFLKTFSTLSCWYSFYSSHWALSDEYPCARVKGHFSGFLHHFV